MRKLIAILAGLFAIANLGFSQSKVLTLSSPEDAGFSSPRLARLDTGMNEWVKKNWVNGSVALIARRGKIIFYKAYGYN
jgi:hypothetical protein